jgi:hypothetical protein
MWSLRRLPAAFHLLALGTGPGAIVARAWNLRAPPPESRLSTVFLGDTLRGLAALLRISPPSRA